MPTIGGGVQSNGSSGFVDQKGDPVSDLDSFQPPLNVVAKRFFQVNRCGEPIWPPFCGQNPVNKQSPGEQDVAGLQELAGERGEFLLRGLWLVQPVL